ncbi:MAG: hypothetical protein IRZ26_07305 [Clostridia bacterium]|nr:hypothetical protein [Clostridia bacterium]MCL6522572.1 hypothetical protein [Bacillota bacterium]
MPTFRDAEQARAILGAVAERARFGEAARGLREAELVVAFVYHDPELTVLMDGRTPAPDGAYMRVAFDTLEPAPDVVFESSGEVGNRFWQGRLDVPMALARGQVKARGPINRALKLLPILPGLYETYREVVREMGAGELLEP